MASLTLARDAQAQLDDLTTLAVRDSVTLFRQALAAAPAELVAVLVAETSAITDVYGAIAADIGMDLYADTRAAAGVSGRYLPKAAVVAPGGQVEAATRWAVAPLFRDTVDEALALANYAGSVDRLVRLPNRHTIMLNTGLDPASTGVIRVARPDACAFCLMLASRGAEHVTLQGNATSDRWHRNCKCQPVPSYGKNFDSMPDPDELYREYAEAVRGASDPAKAWRQHVAEARK